MMKKIVAGILCLAIILTTFVNFDATKTSAAFTYYDCEIGQEYFSEDLRQIYYRFNLLEKSLVSIIVKTSGHDREDMNTTIYDSDFNLIVPENSAKINDKAVISLREATTSRVLDSGVYYIGLYASSGYHSADTTMMVTAERYVQVEKSKITSLSNTSKGKVKVNVFTKGYDLSGFEVQYSTKSDFSDAKTAIIDADGTGSISKLTKGTRYYFRTRSYVLYGNGQYSYGPWSLRKSILVKK